MQIKKELLDQCIAKNQRAQQALYKACFPFFMKICRPYSRDDQEAMSLLNGGFYKVLTGISKKPTEIPFVMWAKKVLINSIIDHYRKNKKHNERHHCIEDVSIYERPNKQFEPFVADYVFEVEEIVALIRNLPTTTSMVFTLFAVDDYSYPEIADRLNITESTVRWHISKARKELIDRMEQLSSKKKLMHEQAG
jgi:RNA polymerase sigma factor (sigma-70 family)